MRPEKPAQASSAVECEVPQQSVLQQRLVAAAYFRDAYRAPLARPNATVVEIFFGIFGHHPRWMKAVLAVRNRIALSCGLAAPTTAELMRLEKKSVYKVGDKIGVWPIFNLTETELVAGRDNDHLDFRLSIIRDSSGPAPTVVVSTVCVVHNRFGKVYLFFVAPFHKWGVKHIIAGAIQAGRL